LTPSNSVCSFEWIVKKAALGLAVSMCVPLAAQWINYPTPGIPRTPDGKPNLAAPAPRTADGKPDLSGIWKGTGTGGYDRNIARDLTPKDIQPWAEALYQQRVRNMGKDAPRATCLPDPFPYYHIVDLTRIIQTPGLIAVLYQGSTNSIYRTIFTDGRQLPKDPNPTWLGYSVGHWEGDTLVVDSAGFNNKSWLDVEGHPQTEALRITERFQRRDFGHMDLMLTIDDPGAFTRPFSFKIDKTFAADTELLETVCENDRSVPHMLGGIEATKLAPDILLKYAGSYEFAPGHDAVITIENDLLFLREGANPLKLPLVATAEARFVSRTNGDWVKSMSNAQGGVTGFTYHTGAAERKAVRKK
jgi:hypothetical protein